MIFRQLIDYESFTYTYLLGHETSREALIIDPVISKVDHYLTLLEQLDLKLVKAIDTHTHADHISALGALRDATDCITVMGKKSKVDMVSMRVEEGDRIEIDGLALDVIYTPGHTDESYSLVMEDRVFTGDALLIRGTGRTDFQGGSNAKAYDSLFNKLLQLPEQTLVYPGHDYKGDLVSTIGEEKAYNPRLQVSSPEEYAAIMDNLNLAHPKMMDVAVPSNLRMGFCLDDEELIQHTTHVSNLINTTEKPVLIDLREDSERTRDGVIPGSTHIPYGSIKESIKPGGVLNTLANQINGDMILYCAYGERSGLALRMALDAGLDKVKHLAGGFEAWCGAQGSIEKV